MSANIWSTSKGSDSCLKLGMTLCAIRAGECVSSLFKINVTDWFLAIYSELFINDVVLALFHKTNMFLEAGCDVTWQPAAVTLQDQLCWWIREMY